MKGDEFMANPKHIVSNWWATKGYKMKAVMGCIAFATFMLSGDLCCGASLYLCGVDVHLGDKMQHLREKILANCKIQDYESNMSLYDRNEKFVGLINGEQGKVSYMYRRWDSYANSTIEELDALYEALATMTKGVQVKLHTEERIAPDSTFRDVSVCNYDKCIDLSFGKIKGMKPNVFYSIQERISK
jgi:hypothetical protein